MGIIPTLQVSGKIKYKAPNTVPGTFVRYSITVVTIIAIITEPEAII